MKRGESRFFLHWQMPVQISNKLFNPVLEIDKAEILDQWLQLTGIYD